MATIRKRGNTYQIRVSCGYTTNGKQITKTQTWKPEKGLTEKQIQKELQKAAVKFEEQVLNGLYLDGTMKFSAFADIWLKEHAEKQLKAKTVFTYRTMLTSINEALGHLKISKIQPHHLTAFYNELSERSKSKEAAQRANEAFFAAFALLSLSKNDLSIRSGVSRSVITSLFKHESISYQTAVKISAAIKKPLESVFEPYTEGKQTLSGKTILNYHRLISSILERAVKWQIIAANPCERVSPPKAERKEAKYLDEKEAAEIIAHLNGEPLKYRALFSLLLYSGMRRGELCGLTWADIDFKAQIIDINKSSLYLPDRGVFDDTTKNKSSARSIKIPSPVLSLLEEWKREQFSVCMRSGSAWTGRRGKNAKVFTRDNGEPLHPDTVTDRFRKFLERHNLPLVPLHSLRHTNATLMIASGVDIRTVSKRLGHAQTSTTANIYAHAIRTADERAAEALDDLLTLGKSEKRA